MLRRPPSSTPFPYTTLFRSELLLLRDPDRVCHRHFFDRRGAEPLDRRSRQQGMCREREDPSRDRKSTRLNSSHRTISYAVFCLKKKKLEITNTRDTEHTHFD